MKKEELKRELQAHNVPENMYNLDGTGRKDERFCLEFASGSWQVFFTERGVRTTAKTFDTENEACQYLFEQLIDQLKTMGVEGVNIVSTKAQNDLNRIKIELSGIIRELESIRDGIEHGFDGIGNDVCESRLSAILSDHYRAKRSLNTVNFTKVTEQYAAYHGG